MDSIYWALALALSIFSLAWVINELRSERREVKRHKAAAVKYRQFVDKQKAKLIADLIERLKLRDTFYPNPDAGIYSRVADIYDRFEMAYFEIPIQADKSITGDLLIIWSRSIADLDDQELFILWFERILYSPADIKDFK